MIALRPAALLIALAAIPAAQAQTAARPAAPAPAPAPAPGNVPQPRQEKIFPLGTTWVAASLNGKPFTAARPSFTLDQQFRSKGFAGCNTFAATAYPLREQNL